MSSNVPSDPAKARNKKVALICAAAFAGMIGLAYASVPLYRAFCELTGFDGTPRRVEAASDVVLDKTLTVRFDANVRDLPWDFDAKQTSQQVKIGETKVAFFKVTNTSDQPITGRAVFNVVPEQAGLYFQKLDCFCFEDQTVGPGETVDMPVLYFIDPKYASDFETKGKSEVTLSYTFFRSTSAPEPAQAGLHPPKTPAPAKG
ncbi:cytochrome c oxidase assembly protein [Phenylobacterium zucineum HLK1]|uniref:Cytochrome c oxidase assembly protein CtaG n=1 Tax=Phenylobacterium zucineum (strain HLK1) TaxID=450851 RepID=B4REX1_PHEZH|nr:cytochrome c oxidase assembly protein [Phenylobacterium zucineum]ACG76959.1 cytochrome c oxidase assembly protein [Phenylobacterium zucineum HLK1]